MTKLLTMTKTHKFPSLVVPGPGAALHLFPVDKHLVDVLVAVVGHANVSPLVKVRHLPVVAAVLGAPLAQAESQPAQIQGYIIFHFNLHPWGGRDMQMKALGKNMMKKHS